MKSEDEQKKINAGEKFVSWLETCILEEATGSSSAESPTDPFGRFWLGRLGPKSAIEENARNERFEPCAVGLRVQPSGVEPWKFKIRAGFNVWLRQKKDDGNGKVKVWHKSPRIEISMDVQLDSKIGIVQVGKEEFRNKLKSHELPETISAEIQIDVRKNTHGNLQFDVTLVNTSDEDSPETTNGRLFESMLEISNLHTQPFILEALPDSFRYDRNVGAWGLNCGTEENAGNITSKEVPSYSRMRPVYWGGDGEEPDLSFEALEKDPVSSCEKLVSAFERWADVEWSVETLKKRAVDDHWSEGMRSEAEKSRLLFEEERQRLQRGLGLLRSNDRLRLAFSNMNKAMSISARGKYGSWRSFQMGFLLSNLASIVDTKQEANIVDVVWFATGGGKTETYLGLLITAALMDRMNGKTTGITAWSRFPLRMLSLQQTQRFANALAAAELVRREMNLPGDVFALGFLVGQDATPNKIVKESKGIRDIGVDDLVASKYQVIEKCPFCRQQSISMKFDRSLWRLEHRCTADGCVWAGQPLPLYVVDDEIWRFLPTVVVGTLDKAANIARQPAMRGLMGAPWGVCSRPGHGFTYAIRGDRPCGCLVPDCKSTPDPLPIDEKLFPPSYRLQDELHLLRDSLGAVDAHYESILDDVQEELSQRKPKILASSATLSGYRKQVEVLYRRSARVFPQPPPREGHGFWTKDSPELMRRFLAVAPRGITIEFAIDRLVVVLQNAVRKLLKDPRGLCTKLGIEPDLAQWVVETYGTTVLYGNTLRDLDAVMRSSETQWNDVDGSINMEPLTGRTDFEKVRQTLGRLEKPEEDFKDRLHLVPASSMMSHGVDIDRLNVMVMLGLPLGTAEFIQATARVGRRWPALVIVVHKIGRERDASVFRAFPQYVSQGDRFVEPIPITRRSRRVLERTLAGLEFTRIHQIHEPQTKTTQGAPNALSTIKNLRTFTQMREGLIKDDQAAIIRCLGLSREDFHAIEDIENWFQNFERNIEDPPTDSKFPSQISPSGEPMLSLRDVEEQAPVSGEDPS